MEKQQHTYIAIDLKSFYASVECVDRGLDPLQTHLVVADISRTEKTICLAISPSLKAYGLPGRARLFEVVQRLRQVNNERRNKCSLHQFTGKSFFSHELNEHPEWEADYITAIPRMARYVEYSRRIFNIYLKYVAEEDIHAYSVDEVFMDVTAYLHAYQHDAHKLTATILQDVLQQTGITATAGIGTNLYLCKVAMDIVAKHLPADKDGLRIARLDETSYREQLWNHRPLTNFWRVGRSTAATLESYGIRSMGQLARFSLRHEALLHKLFGVNAELLIDHAWGWEPCTMQAIKAYHPETTSLGSGQVLSCPYTHAKARVVVHEMADSLSLDLVEKGLVTDRITLTIGYDSENLNHPIISADYRGETTTDHYGRRIPKNAHGTKHLCVPTSSSTTLIKATLALYDRITNPTLLIRRLNLTLHHVKAESSLPSPPTWRQLNLFDDPTDEAKQQEKQQQQGLKERKMQETLLQIRSKYGKNAILKGINFAEGATGKERNKQIGGHKA